MTVGWANGYQTFDVASPVVNEQVAAGGFAGTWSGTPITFWCVQLNQFFNWGNTYSDYTASKPGGLLYTTLGRLFTEVGGSANATSTTMSPAAFQLAVWEIVYQNVAGFNLLSNAFHVTDDNGNAAAVAQAKILLANMPALSLYTVTLLHSEDEQDFTFANPTLPLLVPEPSPLPLVALGLAAMVVALRRRDGTASARDGF
jgi:hypothetical protein